MGLTWDDAFARAGLVLRLGNQVPIGSCVAN